MTTIEKILKLIQERNIEQQALAEHLGIKKQAISDWKSGKTKSYMKHIDKIADYFDVTVDYLLGTESKSSAAVTDDDLKFALFNGADGITDEMFDEVKAFAEFVKNREENKRKG